MLENQWFLLVFCCNILGSSLNISSDNCVFSLCSSVNNLQLFKRTDLWKNVCNTVSKRPVASVSSLSRPSGFPNIAVKIPSWQLSRSRPEQHRKSKSQNQLFLSVINEKASKRATHYRMSSSLGYGKPVCVAKYPGGKSQDSGFYRVLLKM